MVEHRKGASATIFDVAKRAGVSTATVSRVINGSAPVARDTCARVSEAIRSLNYRPHAAAKGLASGRMNALGMIADMISVPFFAPLLQGIEEAASEAGFGVLVHCTQGQPGSTSAYSRALGPHNTDGLLVFAGALEERELRYLHESGFPTVLLLQSPPPSVDIPCVTFENRGSARELISHLIEVHGYRRIAFVQGPESQEDSHWREAGYREALEAHGIPADPSLIAFGGVKGSLAAKVVESWAADDVSVEAVFAFDDDAALELILALEQAGKRVPQDIAVVGFDDIHLAHYLAPPLTTVRAPAEQAGHEAVRQLVRLIETGTADPVTLLPTEVVIRRSCGCS